MKLIKGKEHIPPEYIGFPDNPTPISDEENLEWCESLMKYEQTKYNLSQSIKIRTRLIIKKHCL